jgi:hypothetical protein
MKKILFSVISVFALAGLLILTACPQSIDDGSVENPDTSALQAKIAEAERENDVTVVSTASWLVPLGTYWVSQQTKDKFEAAIETAKGVLDAHTSQNNVNNAVSTLDIKIEQFKRARKMGSAELVIKTDLFAAIAEAESEKAQVVVAVNADDVAKGRFWVTDEQMNDFEAAITTAREALSSSSLTQYDVENAASNLKSTIHMFKYDRQSGNKTTGFTQEELNDLINSANAAKAGVKISAANGDDAGPAEFWVTQYTLETMNNAIAAAQGAADIDKAYLALVSALNIFNAAKDFGSTTNKDALSDAIRNANEVKNGVNVAADASRAPVDSKWATEAQWLPFNTAYNNAVTALSDPNATMSDVETKTRALSEAIEVFKTVLAENGNGMRENGEIGVISGTITLTNINNPRPTKVSLHANGDNWNGGTGSEISLSSVSGSTATVSWTLKIFNDGNEYFPSEGSFRLWVEPAGADRGFNVPITASPTVSGPYAVGIDLGSVNIGTITLSGTINVTYDGETVPLVKIQAIGANGDKSDEIYLNSPDANAPWSIMMLAFDSPTSVRFTVTGMDSDGYERLFFKTVRPDPQLNASNQDIPGINLNLGNVPNADTPDNPTSLTANTWKNGEIADSWDVHWYSIDVNSGTTYYLWWNDSDRGDGTKTQDVDVYAYSDNNGSEILLEDRDRAWYVPVSFTADSTGTFYVRVRCYGGGDSIGTYAIVYNTSGIKPGTNGNYENPFILTENNWANGNLPDGGEQWFAFRATANMHFIHIKFGTLENLYVQVYDSYGDPVENDVFMGGNTKHTLRALDFGQIYLIKVWSWDSNSGNYQIAFNTSSSAPGTTISNDPGGEGNPISLTEDVWKEGNITADTPNKGLWYSFDVESDTKYNVWWNDSDGDGTYELDVTVTVYNSDGSILFSQDTGFYGWWFIPSSDGTVKLHVQPRGGGDGLGKFAIVYSTSGDRPD